MSHRQHEVRLGMSVYWVTTWPNAGGTGYSLGHSSGWVAGDVQEAIAAAREDLEAYERARNAEHVS